MVWGFHSSLIDDSSLCKYDASAAILVFLHASFTVFWRTMLHLQGFEVYDVEDQCNFLFWNVSNHLPSNSVSYRRRLRSCFDTILNSLSLIDEHNLKPSWVSWLRSICMQERRTESRMVNFPVYTVMIFKSRKAYLGDVNTYKIIFGKHETHFREINIEEMKIIMCVIWKFCVRLWTAFFRVKT